MTTHPHTAAPGGQTMSDWQPIETAPKDGTAILIAKSPCDHWSGMFVVYWSDDLDEWAYSTGRIVRQPTHWMPLPAAPEAQSNA